MTTTKDERDLQEAREIVQILVEKEIRLIAVDFDQTIVDVHTSGYWRQGTPALVSHVRPCFKALLEAALDPSLEGILFVCVVTFSIQPILIRDVLEAVLPRSDTHRVFLRANTQDWISQQTNNAVLGKQQHISSICTELYNRCNVIVKSGEILLLDDDDENVSIAKEFGHKAFEIKEDITLKDLKDFAENEL